MHNAPNLLHVRIMSLSCTVNGPFFPYELWEPSVNMKLALYSSKTALPGGAIIVK